MSLNWFLFRHSKKNVSGANLDRAELLEDSSLVHDFVELAGKVCSLNSR